MKIFKHIENLKQFHSKLLNIQHLDSIINILLYACLIMFNKVFEI